MRKFLSFLTVGLILLAFASANARAQESVVIDNGPFFEGFEVLNTDGANVYQWNQQVVSSGKWVANTSYTTYNRAPRSGEWNAYLSMSHTWLFKLCRFTAGELYELEMYARQSRDGSFTNIMVMLGSAANSDQMTTEIVPKTVITNGDYQRLSGGFSVPSSGDYWIGIKGQTDEVLSIDDITIRKAIRYNVTIASNIANGSVNVDKTNPRAGETVTITATPTIGYTLAQYSVTTTSGNSVKVNTNGTFIMPTDDVEVSAEFMILHNVDETDFFESFEDFDALTNNNWLISGQSIPFLDQSSCWPLNGHTGNRKAVFLYSKYFDYTTWMFTPVQLTAGCPYLLELYGTSSSSLNLASVTVMIGNLASANAMTDTIIATTSIKCIDNFTRIFLSFVPQTSGTYMVGFRFDLPISPQDRKDYLAIDDITIRKAIPYKVYTTPFVHGSASTDQINYYEGSKVKVNITSDTDYELTEFFIRDIDSHQTGSSFNKSDSSFLMPSSDAYMYPRFERYTNIPIICHNNNIDFIVDKPFANKGDKITFTATPHAGYLFQGFMASYYKGNVDHYITSNNSYHYYYEQSLAGFYLHNDSTFTVPASDSVLITAFSPVVHNLDTEIFFESFENGYSKNDIIANNWVQELGEKYAYRWEAKVRENNNTPRSGNYYALLRNHVGEGYENWLFVPVQITAGDTYEFEMYARKTSGNMYHYVKIMLGTAGNSSQMTTTIIPTTSINSTKVYERLYGTFSVETSGIYWVGISNYTSNWGGSAEIDDITIAKRATHSISCVAHGGGSLVASSTTASTGDTITLTATPDTNWTFYSLTAKTSKDETIDIDDNKFIMPASRDVTVTAVFESNKKLPIIIDENIKYGKVVADRDTANAGETITLNATPYNSDFYKYIVTNISKGANVSVNSNNQFIMPKGCGVNVSALFLQHSNQNIAVLPTEHGYITVDKTTANKGDTITVTAYPDAGWALDYINYNRTSTTDDSYSTTNNGIANSRTFVMPAGDVSITANFITTINLLVSCQPNDLGYISANKNVAIAGDTITITATPNAGYLLGNLYYEYNNRRYYIDPSTMSFVMPAGYDVNVYASFVKVHDIDNADFFEGFEGFVSGSSSSSYNWVQQREEGSSSWSANSSYTDYNRTPRTGSWNANLRDNNTNWIFVPVQLTEGEIYEFEMYARQYRSDQSYANITVMVGSAADNAHMTTEIVPQTGITNGNYQRLSGGFSVASTGIYWVGIRGYVILSINYLSIDDITIRKSNTYNITVATGITNGSVTVDKTTAKAGETVTITATPATGYAIAQYNVTTTSGEKVKVNTNGTFNMPVDNVEVSAIFMQLHDVDESDFTESFESYAQGNIINGGFWLQQTSTGGNRLFADQSSWPTSGHTGSMKARLSYSSSPFNTWIFTPVKLSADSSYLFELYATSSYSSSSCLASVTAMIGSLAEVDEMTSTIIPTEKIGNNNSYIRFYRSFTPDSSGVYMIGIRIDAPICGIEYVSIDDITIRKAQKYSVTCNSAAHGSISTEYNSYSEGDKVKVNINPDTDYAIKSVTVKDANNTTLSYNSTDSTFIMPTADVYISPTFHKSGKLAVIVKEANHGYITVDKELYNANEMVTITAHPDTDYMIHEYKLDFIGLDSSTTITSNTFPMCYASDVEITPTFIRYANIPIVCHSDIVDIIPDKPTANNGDVVTIAAIPHGGYTLLSITATANGNPLTISDVNSFFVPACDSVVINAQALIIHNISSETFFEGFEDGYTHGSDIANSWTQQSEVGSYSWVANTSYTSYNRTPRTGSWNATLYYSNTDWLFVPVQLTEGDTYEFEMYARQDGSNTSYANITVMLGSAANKDQMTTEIVPQTGITNGDYQRLYSTFSAAADGIYWLGIKGYISGSPYSLSIDDITIAKKATHSISCVALGGGTVVASPTTASANDTISLTVTPDTDWTLHALTATTSSGASVDISDNKLIMPLDDVTVTAEFYTSKNLPITIDPNIQFGTVVADKNTANAGETVTLTATPINSEFYKYIVSNNSTGADVSVSSNEFTMPEGRGVNVSAMFLSHSNQNVAVRAAEHGYITIDKPIASMGETITVTAYPDAGWALNYVRYNRVGTTDSYYSTTDNGINSRTFVMPAGDVEVYANFIKGANLLIDCQVADFGYIEANQNVANAYDTITITATPDAGYLLGNLYYTHNGSHYDIDASTMSFVMPAGYNVSVYATFVEVHNLDNSTFFEGFENRNSNGGSITYNWLQQSEEGSSTWLANTSNISNNSNPRTGSWNAYLYDNNTDWLFVPVQLTAGEFYEFEMYARQNNSTANANITVMLGSAGNNAYMTDTITSSTDISKNNYYNIVGSFNVTSSGIYWIGIKGSVSSGYLFIDDILIGKNLIHNVTVATSIANGSMEVNKTSAMEGETITITATPDAGYTLGQYKATTSEGNSVNVNLDGTFNMPADDVEVSAIFMQAHNVEESNFTESFESYAANQTIASDVWLQQTSAGGNLLIADQNSEPTGGHTGSKKAKLKFLNNSEFSTWLFTPVELTADSTYVLEFFAKTSYHTPQANATAMLGNMAYDSAMTSTIMPTKSFGWYNNTNSIKYNKLVQPFTPDTSGIYMVGLRFDTPNSIYYALIDDITIRKPQGYNVTCNTAVNGSISTNQAMNLEASKVKVNITPDTNYMLRSIVITDEDSNTITFNSSDSTFIMPSANVTIAATFIKAHDIDNADFFEGFENGYTNGSFVANNWLQQSEGGSGSWTATTSMTTPRTGSWSAYLSRNNTDWLFVPVQLTAGEIYEFEMYAKITNSSDANITVMLGNDANNAHMTTEIVPQTGITTGDYQRLSAGFSVNSSGIYWVGIKGYINSNTAYYLPIDDITIRKSNSYNITVATGITNGTVEVNKSTAKATETVTITATPDTEYTLAQYKVTTSSGKSIKVNIDGTFNMPTEDVEVSAVFMQPHKVDVSDFTESFESYTANATIEGDTWLQQGITVIADQSSWPTGGHTGSMKAKLKSSSSGGLFTLVELTADSTYLFELYATSSNSSYQANVTTMIGNLADADAMTSTIIPTKSIGYNSSYNRLAGLFTPDSSGAYIIGFLFNMPSGSSHVSVDDISIKKAKQFSVTCIQAPHGFISTEQVMNIEEDKVKVNITPDTGYDLTSILVKNTNNNSTITFNSTDSTFTMPAANVTITPTFQPNTGIPIVCQANNAIISVDKPTANSGDVVTITAIPNTGYILLGITATANGSSITISNNNSFVVPVCNNVMVTANTFKFHDISSETFFEGFEDGYTHDSNVAYNWKQQSESGSYSWRANTSNTSNNRTPRTGSWNATLYYSNTDWLFVPVQLTADDTYEFEMFARQDYENTSYANITVMLGSAANNDQMTTEIVPQTGITNGDYQRLYGTFSAAADGIYWLGIKGYISGSPYYLSIDDITIAKQAARSISCVALGGGTVVASPTTANTGDTISITVTPDTDWTLHALTATTSSGASVSISDNKLIVPIDDVTVTAEFWTDKKLPIIIDDSIRYGNVLADKVYANAGETVTLTAVPLHNSDFSRFIVTNISTGANISVSGSRFTMPEGRGVNVSAIFLSHSNQNVAIRAAEHGYITVDKPTASMGETVTVTAFPDEGWALDYVRYNSIGSTNNYETTDNGIANSRTFIMPAGDVEVYANFVSAANLAVSCQTAEHGLVFASQAFAMAGDTITITTTPDEGYVLGNIYYVRNNIRYYIDATTCSFVMPAGYDISVYASFAKLHDIDNADFFDGFENGYTNGNNVANNWAQQSEAGSYSWAANSSYTDNNRTPRTGSWNAWLNYSNTDWLFVPVQLTAGEFYRFEMYARQYSSNTNYANITVMLGSAANNANMTTEIVPQIGITDGDYQRLYGGFSVASTGIYWIGIRGYLGTSTNALSIDDISISKSDTYNITVATGITNGTVEVNTTTAKTGETITITTTPATGYAIVKYNVTTTSGKKVKVNTNGTFKMPDEDVEVSAIFMQLHKVDESDFIESFESYAANDTIAGGVWLQQTSAGGNLIIADQSSWPTGGHTGSMKAKLKFIGSESNTWLFTPVELTADLTYLFELYATSYNSSYQASVTAMIGSFADADEMTNTIIPTVKIGYNSNYNRYYGSFTPDSSGVYMVGFRFDTPSSIYYVSIDDIAIKKPQFYRVTCNQTSHGTISTEHTNYPEGGNVKVKITPETGYELTSIEVKNANNGTITFNSTDSTFTMPSRNVTITPTFRRYTDIPIICHGNNVDISVNKTTANKGDVIKISATAHTGYMIGGFTATANGSSITISGANSFAVPACDSVVVTAFMLKIHDISSETFFEGFEDGYTHGSDVAYNWTQHSENGSYSWVANTSNTNYNRTPRTGSWNAYLSSGNTDWLFVPVQLTEGDTYEFEMYARQDYASTSYANITVMLGSAANKDQMTTEIVPQTGITNGDYQRLYSTFSAAADGIYWLGIKGYISGSPYFLSIDDITIAKKATHSISCVALGGGTVVASPTTASANDTISLTVTPDTDWTLHALTATTSSGASISISDNKFIMPIDDVTVTADFYTSMNLPIIIDDSIQFGTVVADKETANAGETVTLTATPINSEFNKYIVTNISTGANISVSNNVFTMPEGRGVTVSALFLSHINQNVIVRDVEHGYLTVDKPIANMGDTITVTAFPDEGWALNQVTYNRVGMNGYTTAWYTDIDHIRRFVMPAGDVEVKASFLALTNLAVNCQASEYGYIAASQTVANEGDTITITATPNNGYTLKELYYMRNGVRNTIDISTYSFVMPRGYDVSVYATFTSGFDIDEADFFEGFESGYTNGSSVAYNWVQQSEAGSYSWTANSSNTTYNRTPRTGSWNAYLSNGNTDWLFVPVQLTAGEFYEFEMYARQDGSNTSDANITVMLGNRPHSTHMTTEIVPQVGITNGGYQRIIGAINVENTDIYWVGIRGYSYNSPYYLSIDDITIRKSNSYNVTIATDIANGNVTVDKTTAKAGETVTIIATPDSGYTLAQYKVNSTYSVKLNTNGTFKMPTENVEVSAIFMQPHKVDESDFIESFESYAANETIAGDVWIQQTTSGGNLVIANQNSNPTGGHTGSMKAQLKFTSSAFNTWMFTPVELCADSSYLFELYATSSTSNSLYQASVTTMIGSLADAEAMTGTIMPTEKIGYKSSYNRFYRSFTPDTSGVYMVGFRFDAPNNANYYVSIDDITIKKPQFYSVTCNQASYGTISTEYTNYPEGGKVKVNITPDTGYELTSIQVKDANNSTITYNSTDSTFIMPSQNVTISGTFTTINYTINKAMVDGGTFSTNLETAHMGDTVTITSTPNIGYQLATINVTDEEGTSITVTNNSFVMPAANVTVSGEFVAIDFTITCATVDNGTLSTNLTSAHIGDTVIIKATPDNGFMLYALNVADENGTSVTIDNDSTFVMPAANVTISGVFASVDFTITCDTIDGGSLSTNLTTAHVGDTVTITSTPNIGYQLATINVTDENGTSIVVTSNTFVMPAASVTVSGTYTAIDFTITCDTVDGGTFSTDLATAHVGDTVMITATPDEGYLLATINVTDENGTSIAVANNYTFVMPAANVTVSGEFASNNSVFTITCASVDGGTFSTNLISAFAGDTVHITATPDEGYQLVSLNVTDEEGTSISVTNNTFVMPDTNVTVSGVFAAIDFTITCATVDGGSFSTNLATAHVGDTVIITSTVYEGYQLASINVTDENGTSITVTSNTFVMPAANVTVSGVFTAIDYTITCDTIDGGSLSTDLTTAHVGDTVVITATPDEGYQLATINVTDENGTSIIVTSNTFVMPAANVTVSVTFTAIDYTITCATVDGGTLSTNLATAHVGDTVIITSTVYEGYQLASINVTDENGTSITVTSNTFVMPAANVTVSVTFAAIDYTITCATADGGSFSTNLTTAHVGDTIHITVTPDEGYLLYALNVTTADGTSIAVTNDYTFVMPATNVTVSGSFADINSVFTITCASVDGGTLSTNLISAFAGDTVQITATPDEGYQLATINVTDENGTSITVTSNTFVMPAANVTVSGEFAAINYTITCATVDGGTFSTDLETAHVGDIVTVTATPNEGYQLATINVTDENGTSITVTSNTFVMPAANVTVSVTFAAIDYTITCATVDGGTFSTDLETAHVGDIVTVTATPNDNYQLVALNVSTENGTSITINSDYTFVMPAANVTVSGEFAAINYTITCATVDGGTFSTDLATAHLGDIVTITATPDEGYQLYAISVTTEDGTSISINNDYTFVMPAANVTVSGEFKELTGVDDIELSKLNIWPNPARNVVKIDGIVADNKADIKVYDLSGRLVISKHNNIFDGSATLDVSELSAGIYYVRIDKQVAKLIVK